ncbi:guanylate kinase-associated protein mars [Pieris napi]|uniref:guanylate kinase-associated protein mars n=1 Tax=Pieris napi TaxID=78633 RepID=UPI001FBB2C1C|nr:guanylate kinase-associated protein mars [Pieris napi]
MENGFDLNALLTNYGHLHKVKPQQFTSVSNGVKKRLETTIKRRHSCRLTIFDKLRSLPQNSPVPKLTKEEKLKQKAEERKLQLEKWKQEKEKKKKHAAAIKKKPFVVGAVRSAPKLEQLPKIMPSTSGRVTRSQVKKTTITKQSPTKTRKSFAPENATFCPPIIKGMEEIPVLILPSSRKGKLTMVSFEPVISEIKLNNIYTDTVENKKNFKVGGNNRIKKNQTAKKVESSQSDESESDKPPTRIAKNLNNSKKNKTITKHTSIKNSVSINEEHFIDKPKYSRGKENKKKSDKLQKKQILSDHSSPEEMTENIIKVSHKKENGKRGKLSAITITSSEDSSPIDKRNTRKSVQREKNNKKTKELDLIEIKDVPIPYINLDSTNSSLSQSPIVKTRKSKSLPTTDTGSMRTPVKPIPNSESSSEERLRSPPEIPLTPEQISEKANLHSPCITTSRGKDNARREMQKKLKEGHLAEHIESMDTVNHFHRQLNMETNRLTEMADHWENILEQNTLPDFVQEAILAAVGQARLLMSQKFQQFAGLVDSCDAADPSQPLVTPVDLQGFWDMVYMQVENLDVRFAKLGEMQARGWAPEAQKPREKRRKAPPPKAAKPATTSRIKDMIAAARKAKKEQEVPESSKTFEAGFFSVQSPIRSPAPATPNKPTTLLKAVLSSEAKKASASKNAASYAMLRASMIGKNIEPEYDSSSLNLIQLTPINLKATPGRSILKSGAKNTRKSLKMVLFDSSDTNPLDSSLDKDISGIKRLESEDSPSSELDNPQEIENELTKDNEDVEEDAEESTGKENIDESMKKENDASEGTETKKTKKGRSPRVTRQDAFDFSPVKTRSGRKSDNTRKEVLQEANVNTPRRSLRRKSTMTK